jgi:phosphate transport system ATP-binding protein
MNFVEGKSVFNDAKTIVDPHKNIGQKLKIENFCAESHGSPLYTGISFEINHGVIGLCGPSGIGKSTFLQQIVNLNPQHTNLKFSGKVYLNNLQSSELLPSMFRKSVCLLPQHPVVFPGSVAQNVLLGARNHGLLKGKKESEVLEFLLEKVGLWNEVKHVLKEPAHRLSLGQKQRLCLARTFGVEPDFLLLDEPTASLDSVSQKKVEDSLLEFSKTKAAILVTHCEDQRTRVCGTCLELHRGGGFSYKECFVS